MEWIPLIVDSNETVNMPELSVLCMCLVIEYVNYMTEKHLHNSMWLTTSLIELCLIWLVCWSDQERMSELRLQAKTAKSDIFFPLKRPTPFDKTSHAISQFFVTSFGLNQPCGSFHKNNTNSGRTLFVYKTATTNPDVFILDPNVY